MRDWPTALRASHHLLVSHGLAVDALRAPARRPQVGITLNLHPMRPASAPRRTAPRRGGWTATRTAGSSTRCCAAATRRTCVEHYERRFGPLHACATATWRWPRAPIDFLGVNYYIPLRVRAAPRDAAARQPRRSRRRRRSRRWAGRSTPTACTRCSCALRRDYGDLTIYITENGAAFDDEPARNGCVDDPERLAYLQGHLGRGRPRARRRASTSGATSRGRCSTTSSGSTATTSASASSRVDYATQRRVPKRSGLWYRDYIARVRARRSADGQHRVRRRLEGLRRRHARPSTRST